MKTVKQSITLLIILLFSISSIAQNGINYKAIVKDGSGNVLANQLITVQFQILQGVAQTNVYEELHTPTTDTNGLILLNIGEGILISGDYTTINWASDTHFLNVQINTGGGLVDMGTTEFKTVPYALQAKNAENVFSGNYDDLINQPTITTPTGLEELDEGNGIGWSLVGRDPNNYGNIGEGAVDLSYNSIVSTTRGATGNYSTAMGKFTIASGSPSTAMGRFSIASGFASTAMGSSAIASGAVSTAIGSLIIASGDNSTAMGFRTDASSYVSMAVGRYNIGGGDPSNWIDTDPLFEIGNGGSDANRSNALTVLKNGKHIIKSTSDGISISSDENGIEIFNPRDGIYILDASHNGISVVAAGNYGGNLTGANAGLFATTYIDTNPDLILGGNGNTASEDNGIISSDPNYSSSDIFLRSYDAVVVQLDYDNNEIGQFEIKNGAGTEVFEVTEAGNVSVNGTIVHASDRRLKKDIKDLQYGLTEILQLQPKAYNWKNRDQNYKSLGLIAQEVQPIIKEIVTAKDNKQKTLGISYVELIPILINAIKEQQEIIENQDSEISTLTSELIITNNTQKAINNRLLQLEELINTSQQ